MLAQAGSGSFAASVYCQASMEAIAFPFPGHADVDRAPLRLRGHAKHVNTWETGCGFHCVRKRDPIRPHPMWELNRGGETAVRSELNRYSGLGRIRCSAKWRRGAVTGRSRGPGHTSTSLRSEVLDVFPLEEPIASVSGWKLPSTRRSFITKSLPEGLPTHSENGCSLFSADNVVVVHIDILTRSR